MNAGLSLLLSRAAVCYSAALPKDLNGNILNAMQTTPRSRLPTTVKTTANPISTYIDDNEDDSSDDTTDDGSGDESYFSFSGCGKCQIFGLNPSPPQITTSQMILGQILIVGTGENGPDGGEQRRPPMTRTTMWSLQQSIHHLVTTMAYRPRVTWWSKRDAAPQSDDEFDFTSFDNEVEEPEEVDILEMEETDSKKRNALPQTKFSVTLDIDYPIETFDEGSYVPTRAPSRTTDGGPFGSYGSWFPIATTSRKYLFVSTTYKSPVATTTRRYPGVTTTRTYPGITTSHGVEVPVEVPGYTDYFQGGRQRSRLAGLWFRRA
ncbi:hypothetical protein F5882DRAFT_464698 [Hyaloscypha sp. PMI_1271]|nr:hypothetical protein F5882DRAFT_464698 [Hyaloscypha sp. PMI_1271]